MIKLNYKHYLLLVCTFLMIGLLGSCDHPSKENKKTTAFKIIKKQAPKMAYGIRVDSLKVIKGVVKRNQYLSDILLKYNVDYNVIDYIARHTRNVFDVRDMRKGHHYAIMISNDSIPKARYFVYERSPKEYVRYHLYDTIYASLGEKPVKTVADTSVGVIKSSLWNAIQDNNDDVNLAIRLSEIYAWTIDFFELQSNDQYKVLYKKRFIDGKYVGLGKIIAANFIHKGQSHYAFYFEQNGKAAYFDENGISLQRSFLKAPLKYSRISSRFSNHRWHPILKIYRAHHGVDYAAPEGTPVHSIGDGEIIAKGYQRSGGGNYIKVRHNSTYTTQYAHLRRFAKGMKVGLQVKQGQTIGYVGHTGLATGPHLDFRVYKLGTAVNPLSMKSPPTKPIFKSNQQAFDSLVKQYMPALDSL